MMTGYPPYPGTEPLMLTLCLQEDSILLNNAILEALGRPRQVQMLINEERKTLLLLSCTVDDREAVVIPAVPMQQFEMSGHALLRRIRRLTGWADEKPRVIYGNFIPSHNAIVFELSAAMPAKYQMPLDKAPGILN